MLDGIALVIVQLAGVFGGSLGLAVLAASTGLRLALLPLTVRAAVEGRRRADAMAAIQPELEALKVRFPDPLEQREAMMQLLSERGLTPGLATLAPMLVQLPFAWALFGAVRRLPAAPFLWMGSLARPDAAVAVLVGVLSALAGVLAADTPSSRVIAGVMALVVLVVASRMAAAVGLLMAGSAGVGVLQAVLVRRRLGAVG
ncbi:MAG: YidC/Oxa1 family membrane protein insertase [Alphaproteobacteria bacterium]|nr:YidC/Oxa1 family membrane protein insertase [Alphaproteobacteria bacterium]MCB9692278.1 YidC/Oxa1 family membrane protein insertase [Alphaproteobacteria bacterium]